MPARSAFRGATLALLMLAATDGAHAGEWRWSVTPYLWATDVGAKATIADRDVLDAEIAFEDLLEDVDAAAQLHLEAQRGKHGAMLDLFAVELSDDESRMALPRGAGEATVASRIAMSILEAGGTYNPRADGEGFWLLYDTRILDRRFDVDARFDLPSTTLEKSYDASGTLVDGLLGVRYVKRLSQRWTGSARVDASTGGTDLTWSAGAAAGFALGETGRYALTAGYRYLAVDFDDDGALDTEMTLSGAFAGLRISF